MTTAIATSLALDLSALPAPDIVEQIGFEQILAELVSDLQARWTDFSDTVATAPATKTPTAADSPDSITASTPS